ncbi:MAG: hypothetical protein AB7E80_05855 [Hyphomicrobiaceae bacterium]
MALTRVQRPISALIAATVLLAPMVSAPAAVAQVGPGGVINPQRDCQTVVTCNFRRGGSYRGCLSSYSCRRCRFVPARCSVGDRRRNCQRLTCSWGG